MQHSTEIKEGGGGQFGDLHICKDDIKMEFTKTGCEEVDCIQMILVGSCDVVLYLCIQ